MNEWQDISTAPKDGTPILVYFATGNPPRIEEMYWSDSESGGSWKWLYDGDYPQVMVIQPTHWFPLPDPPKQTT